MKYLLPSTLVLLLFLLLPACGNDSTTKDAPGGTPLPTPITSDTTTSRKAPKEGIEEDYTNTNRVIWQKPEMVIELLGNLSGKTVADIGAGTGFFALRLAPEAEKVIAIDIDRRFTEYLDSVKVFELPEDMQEHLETRLAQPDDPRLAPNEADVVMIVNTYMYIKNRVQYLKDLKEGIAPGGRLLIIDFKKKRTPIGPPSEIRIPLFQVEEELYEAGYRNILTNDTALDYQYILLAEK